MKASECGRSITQALRGARNRANERREVSQVRCHIKWDDVCCFGGGSQLFHHAKQIPSKSSTKITGSDFECRPPRGRFERDVTRSWLILDCRDLLLHDMFRLTGSWLDLARQALSARGTCVMTSTFGT